MYLNRRIGAYSSDKGYSVSPNANGADTLFHDLYLQLTI